MVQLLSLEEWVSNSEKWKWPIYDEVIAKLHGTSIMPYKTDRDDNFNEEDMNGFESYTDNDEKPYSIPLHDNLANATGKVIDQ